MAIKFAEHFIWIARAMNQTGPEGMWDEEDGFYYDVLRLPDGSARRLRFAHGGLAALMRHHCDRAVAARNWTPRVGENPTGTLGTYAGTGVRACTQLEPATSGMVNAASPRPAETRTGCAAF